MIIGSDLPSDAVRSKEVTSGDAEGDGGEIPTRHAPSPPVRIRGTRTASPGSVPQCAKKVFFRQHNPPAANPQGGPSLSAPLQGIRVVDFTRLLPGPFCTRLLCDLGAEVITVEDLHSPDYLRNLPPTVGGMNVAFAWLHRGKRSVRLDLRRPEGVAAARRLIERADVVVESFRPGRMAALGLDGASLAVALPRLVYCSLSGYGQSGPLRAKAGHDINYQARSGLGSLTGSDGDPLPSGAPLADLGGALYAAIAILAALLARDRGHPPAPLDVSLTDAAFGMLGIHAAEALGVGHTDVRGRGILQGRAPAYRLYACADGAWLAVGAIEPRFWATLCDALELPDLARDGLAHGPRGEDVAQRVATRFRERTRAEWLALLAGVDCCVEPVLEVEEALDSTLAQARGLVVEVMVGGRPVRQPACPLRFGDLPTEGPRAAGSDTRELLAEAGYSPAELASLEASGLFG